MKVEDSFYLISALHSISSVIPMRVDIGRTAMLLRTELNYMKATGANVPDTIAHLAAALEPKLAGIQPPLNPMTEARDVVLYGFGRIGRLLARVLIEKTGSGSKLLLRAVVIRKKGSAEADLMKRASLLRWDSVHGPVRINNHIII